MSSVSPSLDVFSAGEIARAAGVDVRDIRALLASGRVATVGGRFVPLVPAIEVVRSIRTGTTLLTPEAELFRHAAPEQSSRGLPFVGSALGHVLMLGGLAFITAVGVAEPGRAPFNSTELIFLASPGPGGGGGGGGLQQLAPPARAELFGKNQLRSPVATRRVVAGPRTKPVPPPEPSNEQTATEPPLPEQTPEPTPEVTAPVASVAADARDRAGVPVPGASDADNRGQGRNGGTGSGAGTGLGEGDGTGIGPGTGGGTGGGPYRPGSGITPPSLVREVKPDYTEDARRRGINGDVELEIVVRSDGTVGEVRLQRGLGAGLDQRAIDAVRQWRFSPARRFGTPVDVLVEVAVEFKLR